MNFNDDYERDSEPCECGDPECASDKSVEAASGACDEAGEMINEIIRMVVVHNNLSRKETHMMVGMILGQMLAQGFKNTHNRYGMQNAQSWISIIMRCLAEEVLVETNTTLAITVTAKE